MRSIEEMTLSAKNRKKVLEWELRGLERAMADAQRSLTLTTRLMRLLSEQIEYLGKKIELTKEAMK